MTTLAIAAVALGAEAAFGYPDAVFRAIGHPVTWMGALIGWLDRRGNRERHTSSRRRWSGLGAVVALLIATAGPASVLQMALLGLVPEPLAVLAAGLLAASLPAQRSLHAHVRAVAEALERNGLPAGRLAVAHIVGRDPDRLDRAGVARAAIESLAENFSDGVVGPALWCAIGGLPGIAAYKAVNTADSMIGHRTARHAAFGWAAARLDDVVNLPASRLSALWLTLAAAMLPGASAAGAWQAVWRDARRHRSPNAGWPEAAIAGALGLRLAGPRVYGSLRVEDAWMGDGRDAVTEADIRRALSLYRLACGIQLAAIVLALLSLRA